MSSENFQLPIFDYVYFLGRSRAPALFAQGMLPIRSVKLADYVQVGNLAKNGNEDRMGKKSGNRRW